LDSLLEANLDEDDKIILSTYLSEFSEGSCDLSELLTNLLQNLLIKLPNSMIKYKLLAYIRQLYIEPKYGGYKWSSLDQSLLNCDRRQFGADFDGKCGLGDWRSMGAMGTKEQLDLRLFEAMMRRYLVASNALMLGRPLSTSAAAAAAAASARGSLGASANAQPAAGGGWRSWRSRRSRDQRRVSGEPRRPLSASQAAPLADCYCADHPQAADTARLGRSEPAASSERARNLSALGETDRPQLMMDSPPPLPPPFMFGPPIDYRFGSGGGDSGGGRIDALGQHEPQSAQPQAANSLKFEERQLEQQRQQQQHQQQPFNGSWAQFFSQPADRVSEASIKPLVPSEASAYEPDVPDADWLAPCELVMGEARANIGRRPPISGQPALSYLKSGASFKQQIDCELGQGARKQQSQSGSRWLTPSPLSANNEPTFSHFHPVNASTSSLNLSTGNQGHQLLVANSRPASLIDGMAAAGSQVSLLSELTSANETSCHLQRNRVADFKRRASNLDNISLNFNAHPHNLDAEPMLVGRQRLGFAAGELAPYSRLNQPHPSAARWASSECNLSQLATCNGATNPRQGRYTNPSFERGGFGVNQRPIGADPRQHPRESYHLDCASSLRPNNQYQGDSMLDVDQRELNEMAAMYPGLVGHDFCELQRGATSLEAFSIVAASQPCSPRAQNSPPGALLKANELATCGRCRSITQRRPIGGSQSARLADEAAPSLSRQLGPRVATNWPYSGGSADANRCFDCWQTERQKPHCSLPLELQNFQPTRLRKEQLEPEGPSSWKWRARHKEPERQGEGLERMEPQWSPEGLDGYEDSSRSVLASQTLSLPASPLLHDKWTQQDADRWRRCATGAQGQVQQQWQWQLGPANHRSRRHRRQQQASSGPNRQRTRRQPSSSEGNQLKDAALAGAINSCTIYDPNKLNLNEHNNDDDVDVDDDYDDDDDDNGDDHSAAESELSGGVSLVPIQAKGRLPLSVAEQVSKAPLLSHFYLRGPKF